MGEKFTCAACGAEAEKDVVTEPVAECRICRRLHCPDCLTPDGVCKKCKK